MNEAASPPPAPTPNNMGSAPYSGPATYSGSATYAAPSTNTAAPSNYAAPATSTAPTNTASHTAEAGDHVLRAPLWLVLLRGWICLLSLTVLILAAVLADSLYFDEEGLALAVSLITFFVIAYILLSDKLRSLNKLYHVVAVMSLDVLMMILWLATFAAMAAKRVDINHIQDDYDDCYYGYCYRKRDLTYTAGVAMMSAIAGIGAWIWLLFIACFVFTLIMFLKGRKQGRFPMRTPSSTPATNQGQNGYNGNANNPNNNNYYQMEPKPMQSTNPQGVTHQQPTDVSPPTTNMYDQQQQQQQPGMVQPSYGYQAYPVSGMDNTPVFQQPSSPHQHQQPTQPPQGGYVAPPQQQQQQQQQYQPYQQPQQQQQQQYQQVDQQTYQRTMHQPAQPTHQISEHPAAMPPQPHSYQPQQHAAQGHELDGSDRMSPAPGAASPPPQ